MERQDPPRHAVLLHSCSVVAACCLVLQCLVANGTSSAIQTVAVTYVYGRSSAASEAVELSDTGYQLIYWIVVESDQEDVSGSFFPQPMIGYTACNLVRSNSLKMDS